MLFFRSLFCVTDYLLTQARVHQIELLCRRLFLGWRDWNFARHHDEADFVKETRENSPFVMKPTVYFATRLTPPSLLLPCSKAFAPAPRAMSLVLFTREIWLFNRGCVFQTSIFFTYCLHSLLSLYFHLISDVLDPSTILIKFFEFFPHLMFTIWRLDREWEFLCFGKVEGDSDKNPDHNLVC